jgi:hypothetical protein
MPSFKEIAGLVTTFVILSVASGHGEWVWKGIAFMRYRAVQENAKNWGCPSIFNKNACAR